MVEAKSTCCGKCGHVHAKGTSCPKPFLSGKSHCSRRANEMHTIDDDGPNEFHQVRADVEEASKGLWANINAKRARGEKSSPKGSKAYKAAVAAGNKLDEVDEINEYCPMCLAEYIMENYNKLNEAEYRGRKVSLGKPFLTPGGPKKRSVYVKNAKGNVVKVNFGDPNMRIKKSNPGRRKSFRARHNCSNPGPRDKARYWSCRAW
jgi:predicted  nucleic acid-binding Zn-ribbon protein